MSRPALRRLGGALLLAAAVLAGAAALWVHHRLAADLPCTLGNLAVRGLAAPVAVERDALGIPSIAGVSRRDVAFAIGFVHGEDRFFQMGLLRRRAAGELSELFGPATLKVDLGIRRHLFRARARRILAASPPEVRDLLAAYAGGVNAGLRALDSPPFEYLVLRADPGPGHRRTRCSCSSPCSRSSRMSTAPRSRP